MLYNNSSNNNGSDNLSGINSTFDSNSGTTNSILNSNSGSNSGSKCKQLLVVARCATQRGASAACRGPRAMIIGLIHIYIYI